MSTEYAFFVGGDLHGTWNKVRSGSHTYCRLKLKPLSAQDLGVSYVESETFEEERYRSGDYLTTGFKGHPDLRISVMLHESIPKDKKDQWVSAALVKCAINSIPR